MTGSSYPMEYQSDLASQSAAVRAAQQAARQYAAQSAAHSLMSAPPPPSSLPSSSLTLPSSSQTPQGVDLTCQSIQPAQSLVASSILPPIQSQSQYYDFQQSQDIFLPPLNNFDQFDTRYLTKISPQLDNQIKSITSKINGMKRAKNPTPEYQNEIKRFSKYKEDLKNYRDTFRQHLNNRYQTGTGIWNKSPIIFNNISPQELLNRLELLDGSLAAGNNGVLPEYIQIAHRLRDLGVVTDTQLNALLRKQVDV